MKKLFTSLLIGCSLTLAGAAMAQQPDQQSTPKKKQGVEKTHAAGVNAPPKPQERPAKQTGAMQGHGAMNQPGAANEPGAGKGRKGQPKSETATQMGTNVSGQPTGTATNEAGVAKGRKGRAHEESGNAHATGTDVSGQSAGSATPGAKQHAEQQRKGMKSPAPAAASASVAPSVSSATHTTAPTGAAATAKKVEPQKVQQVKAQAAQIKQQHTNFKAQPRPQQVQAVTFNQNHRIEGSEHWQGQQYEVFRSYHPEWHDEGWYHSHYPNVTLIAGGYYFFNNGYWFPAWGYSPSAQYYAYDGPIYAGQRAEPPDQVIADVQAELQQMGYYQGEVDGLLGPLTREALTAYQADQGLATTAAIDQPTLDSLGMG